jgi:hypothetical protein
MARMSPRLTAQLVTALTRALASLIFINCRLAPGGDFGSA